MASEVSFPRGGKRTKSNESSHTQNDNDNLFKVLKESKTRKLSKRSKKKNDDDSNPPDTDEVVVIEQLGKKTVLNDMLVLGCLYDISDYGLSVSLPGGLKGRIPVTNISDQYTQLLQKYSEDPQSQQENISTLSSMYEVGCCLPMRVKSHVVDSSETKSHTILSINPKDVNKDCSPSSVFHGMVLLSSVQSVEDHGYVMDVGIGNLQGFLRKSDSKRLQATTLCVGQTVLCAVDMPDLADKNASTKRVLTLTMKNKIINSVLDLDENHVSMNCLLPGAQVKCMVFQVRKNGLIVKCSQYSGCVHRDNLKNVFDITKKYDVGKEVVGTVLYHNPITNTLHITLADKITPRSFNSLFPDIKYGDIIEEARVINITKSSVYFQIADNIKGFAVLKHLNDNNEDIDNPSDSFHVDEKHRCRILGFNHMDRIILVSLRKEAFKQKLVAKDSIKVGEIFSGVVSNHVKEGVKVNLGQKCFGILPYLHLSDKEVHNPSRMFPSGTKVQCRVLRVDKLGNNISPLLTCKRTMVLSKHEPLASYEQAEMNSLYHGYVVQVNSNGLKLGFYNGVKGWVPVEQLSSEYIQYPEKVFHIGQVVTARLIDSKPEERKLTFSLKLDTRKPFGQKEMTSDSKLRSGDLISAKVIGKNPKGLDLMILNHNLKGFLPVNHLSDHPRLCKLFLELYDVGDVLDEVLCFSTKGTIIVSKKQMLCQAAQSGNFIHDWNNIQPGQLVPGVIKAFLSYGIFVDFGNGFSELVHKKNILDAYVTEPGTVGYVTHQTLVAKVLDFNPDSHRISLSTRLSDVCRWPQDPEDGIVLLDNFLSHWREIASLNKKKGNLTDLANLNIGDVVDVTISSITSDGILCETDAGVAGIVTNQNIGDSKLEVQMNTEAVVLHVDFKNNCAELSLCPRLVKNCKKAKLAGKTIMNQLMGQSVLGTVLLIRTHFALTALHAPHEGILAYIPLFKHPNDLVGISYKTGEIMQLSVQRTSKHFLICSKCNEDFGTMKRKLQTDGSKKDVNKKKMKIQFSKDEQENFETQIWDSNREDDLKTPSGIVTSIKGKSVFVKLRSGHSGVLTKQSMKGHDADSLSVGTRIKVKIVKKKGTLLTLHLSSIDGNVQSKNNPKHATIKRTVGERDGEESRETDSFEFKREAANVEPTNNRNERSGIVTNFTDKLFFVKLDSGDMGLVKKHGLTKEQSEYLYMGAKVQVEIVGKQESFLKLKVQPDKQVGIPSSIAEFRPQKYIRNSEELHHKENQRKAKTEAPKTDSREEHCGIVTNFNDKDIFVKLDSEETGIVKKHTLTMEQSDCLFVGAKLQVLIVGKKGSYLKLSVSCIDQSAKKDIIPTSSFEFKPLFGKKDSESSEESDSEDMQNTVAEVHLSKYAVPITSSTVPKTSGECLKTQDSLQWDIEATPNLSLMEGLQAQNNESSDEDDELKDRKSKTGAKGKMNRLKEEEEFLCKQEQQMMDPGYEPDTVDKFDRLVLSQPDNSVVWVKYMSFHLQQAEVDKARAAAQRALSTISFREEQEKLNVWFAWLNLENLYGTSESLETTFQKAVQFNEPFKVYVHLANLYTSSGKNQEAENLYTVMLKKFKGQIQPWLDFALHCFKTGKNMKAQNLFQQSLNSLDKRHHVEFVCKFAHLEFKHGETERGKTMMEGLVSSYPKRTDLWSQYADLLLKCGDIQGTRQVLERSIGMNLSAKKMKFLFKKYLDFEKNHGDEKLVEKIKERAREYVQSKSDD